MAPCQFGIWYNGKERYNFFLDPETRDIEQINNIPPSGLTLQDIEKPDFDQLTPAYELDDIFERCHNYIAGNEGLQKTEAFHELLKLIFCKVMDERTSQQVRFYVTNNERKENPERCKSRINRLFTRVKDAHPEIFDSNEDLELTADVVAYIVAELESYSLVQTDTDVKGDAYEQIVGGNLRGDRGEFFTPRTVCRSAVEMMFHIFPDSDWNDLSVLDPACGSAGFLISVINFIKRNFYQQELDKWKDDEKALKLAQERTQTYCELHLNGVDINPTLVRAAQMNEVMHGDGHGNLFVQNSLQPESQWPSQMQTQLGLNTLDMAFTNPPFGSNLRIENEQILRQFDIGHIWEETDDGYRKKDKLRSSAPPEQLFIERVVQFLRPGGRAAIVIPDNLLTNPGLGFLRHWMLQNTKVVASVDLPRQTFEPYTGTNTHLVILEKYADNPQLDGAEETFMAVANDIGHDKRGNKVFLRNKEGKRIVTETTKEVIRVVDGEKIVEEKTVTEPVIDNDLPAIVERFKDWWEL